MSGRRCASCALACFAAFAVGCAAVRAPLRPTLPLGDDEVAVGVPGRSRIVAASLTRRWAVLLQARADTNGDGVVCSSSDGHHGFEVGDRPSAWLVLGSGPGEPIDELYGTTDDQRFLVFSRDDEVVLLDLDASERTTLGPRTARTQWPHLEAGESALVSSSWVVYRRSDREATVIDPRTGVSTTYTIPTGWLFRAFVTRGWLVAEVLDGAPADPTSTSELPHVDSSAGDLQCSLAHGACWGAPGRVILFPLGDPSQPIDAGHDGVAVAPWGFVRATDEGALVLVQHPSGRATPITEPGCRAQLLTLGERPHYVVYRCEQDRVPRVLVFPDDDSMPPSDETARVALGAAAWEALGAPEEDTEHLAALGETSGSMYFGGHASQMHPVPHEPSEATAIHRIVPRCGEPLTAYHREVARVCAHAAPDVEVIGVRRDGEAMARVRRGTEAPACPGDDTQIVWTHVEVDDLR